MSYHIDERNRMRMREKIIIGAQKYKSKLIDKDFLVICKDGNTHIVRFFSKDFIHLTGVISNLNDTRFFEKSSNGSLSVNNILENQKYNLSTLKGKTDRIENIDQIVYGNIENSLFMINLHTNTCDYPVAIRNRDINTCIGFKDNINRARTLRKYSNSTDADEQKEIVAIFSKRPDEQYYSELVYLQDKTLLLENNKNILDLIVEELKSFLC